MGALVVYWEDDNDGSWMEYEFEAAATPPNAGTAGITGGAKGVEGGGGARRWPLVLASN